MAKLKSNENDIYFREEKRRLDKERRLLEEEFSKNNRNASDDELLQLLRDKAKELGKAPTKQEFVGFVCLKMRFGPWPRVLERAGLKSPKKSKHKILNNGEQNLHKKSDNLK